MQFRLDNLTTRVFLVATLLVTLAAVGLAMISSSHERDEWLQKRAADMANGFFLSESRLRQAVDTLRNDAIILSRLPAVADFQRALPGNDDASIKLARQRLEDVFVAFAEAKSDYFQLRFIGIDDHGRELVRIELGDHGRAIVIPPQELQAKGERDYFRETLKLKQGEVYLSRFDLNEEHGSVGIPVTPTLRAATPLFAADGRISGMIVINLATRKLLDNFNRGVADGVLTYLASDQGDFLAHPDPRQVLGFSQGSPARWQDELRDLMLARNGASGEPRLQEVTTRQGTLHVLAGQIHFDPLQPERKLHLAFALPDTLLEEELGPVRLQVALAAIVLLALVLLLIGILLSRVFAPLRGLTAAAEAIADGNYEVPVPLVKDHEIGALSAALRHMQERVAARENELLDLAGSLEARVAARTADLQLAASVFEHTTEGVMVADAATNIVSINPAFTAITGYTADEAIGKTTSLLRSDRQGAEFYKALWKDLNLFGYWQGEIWNRRKNGEVYLEWLTINRIVDGAGRPYRYVAVFHDITEMHSKAEHMRHLAYHDALTGLPNRLLLEDRLSQSMAAAHREGNKTGLLFIDLDRFKQVNDSHGHLVGDQLLEEVARRLKACVRDSDTVARLGGDEFVILLPKLGTTADGAALAEKLIASLSAPMTIAGHTVEIGASVGIAVFPTDGDTPEEIMKNADAAMYAAKTDGRGVFVFYAGHQAA